ncbi:MAG: cobalamin biosynthesis protein, partial [Planctomycetes bacterium]|nr:cobalamin biosynthesis protein [Planctomycetota bacterium]
VRAIASHIRSKLTDPAVVAVDEKGCFAVSVLSGHVGGANALAETVGRILSATPVITTATDVHRLFAIDAWAARNSFVIINPHRVKTVTAAYLAGGTLRLRTNLPWRGELPERVEVAPLAEGNASRADETEVVIGIRCCGGGALHLVPPIAALGMGCRRGTGKEALEQAFTALCQSAGIRQEAVSSVCSIDLKKEEQGLIAFAAERNLPFTTFSSERLAALPGEFSSSAFVEHTAGVDNVCERAAVLGAGHGELIVAKTVFPGITAAIAVKRLILDFSA